MSENTRLASVSFWINQREIPSSTRIPVEEIKKMKGDSKITILDLGSGEGRSTQTLKENFPLAQVVAFDLCKKGLLNTNESIVNKVQGTTLKLPFKEESADVTVLCGVMTNLTDKDPKLAIQARQDAIREIARVLKPGGMCIISDFNREHQLSNYPVNYERHGLITGELGTIAVFDPDAKITFVGKSDEEIVSLKNSSSLRRYTHHYFPEELIELGKKNGLTAVKHTIELGKTPSGNPIDTVVMSFIKPEIEAKK